MTYEEIKKDAPSEVAASEQGVKDAVPSNQFITKSADQAIFHLGIIEGLTIEHPNHIDINYHVNRLIEYIREVK